MEEVIAKDVFKNLKKYQTKYTIVDVREPEEFDEEKIEGAVNMPLGDLQNCLNNIDKKKEVMLICLSGLRAKKAAAILEQNGFKVALLKGGMIEWRKANPPVYPEGMEGGDE
jgi:rhodanese-related sulfurtransferase